LSVVMCNYNHGHYIQEALQAILSQSFWFDLQVIWITLLKVFQSEGVSH
jgi:glycosyltransferase involved in cell wall biosynthesis